MKELKAGNLEFLNEYKSSFVLGVLLDLDRWSGRGVNETNVTEAVDEDMIDELVLFITNDGDIYRQRIQPIIKNLKRKQARGIYDPELAVKAFSYAAQDGLKKYAKEFGSLGLQRGEIGTTRMAIASQLLDYYTDQLEDETDPMTMHEVDLPGGENQKQSSSGPDKNKLKQLETIFSSMDEKTQSTALEMLNMVQSGANVNLQE